MGKFAQTARSLAFLFCGLVLALAVGEAMVRLATADQRNYVIEMWRYALLLKQVSADPAIGHEHRPHTQARLENVEVAINSLGLRGPEPRLGTDKPDTVAILGDSIAMSWGVPEDQSLRAQLERRLGPETQVVAAAVGNMNMSQIIAHWLPRAPLLRPRAVIVLADARATDDSQEASGGPTDWLVSHSQLAALATVFIKQWQSGMAGREQSIAAYQASWNNDAKRQELRAALDQLAQSQREYGFSVIVAMMPLLSDFKDYPFDFMTRIMAAEAQAHGWGFIDLAPPFLGRDAADFRVSPQDFHPNAQAFTLVTDQLAPMLRR